ncbi:hypothetical protein KBZ07_11285 [Cyanobium sp. BA20m-14]|uniref:hypothetical protein n=1 Tax=Cyanobium sp. BA20m-14 TaxID=2823703 RepID=UPI0020CDC341|nr:hypothetical protein [Cyanobium sp. BA20m-14]MCP9913975.1 hypothetical protein [Cyanobium sp. BA20m-14]
MGRRADLLVFVEIDKMADRKAWLKGVIDARPVGQALLFDPESVREWCAHSGFPDTCLAERMPLSTSLDGVKLANSSPHRALSRFALQFPEAEAVQLVRDARQQEQRGAV